jgi:hypothetical protein
MTEMLPKFMGGDKEANSVYRREWRPMLISALRSQCRSVHPLGLLGFALTEAQFFEATGARVAFVPRGPVDDRPAGNASAATLHFYREDKEAYTQQQNAMDSCLRAIWASLGESPRCLITNQNGELFSDLRLILVALDARYLMVTRQELRGALESLSSLQTSENFEATMAKHRQVHALFAAANQPLAEFQKVELLLRGFENEEGLNQASERFFSSNPDVRLQTFNALVVVLSNQIANAPAPVRRDYVNNVRTTTEANQVMEAVASIAASVAEMKRGMKKGVAKPPQQPQQKRFYCWTHGTCSHSGKYCQSKGNGHKDNATFENKLGGHV